MIFSAMITEDQLEQLAIQWFQDTGWDYVHAAVIAPEGVGSLTAGKEWFMPWRTISNENDKPQVEFELEKVVRGFFRPDLFLDYVRYFILFEQDGDGLIKKIAGYHQFHGVREAVRVTLIASATEDFSKVKEDRAAYGKEVVPGSKKAGVFWHTQGSGKSTSMCCYAGGTRQHQRHLAARHPVNFL